MFVVQVRTGRCSPSPPSTSVSTRASATVGVSEAEQLLLGSFDALITASVCFDSGSINKKKEKRRKKGLSYEELRLPAITAFSSGGTQTKLPSRESLVLIGCPCLRQRRLVSRTGTGSWPVTAVAA